MSATSRRVLVTDADEFVGPAAVERFRTGGDDVVARREPLTAREQVDALVRDEGPFEVVVANLPSYFPPATVADPEFRASVRETVPAQRLGAGAEAAAALWWLASPEASYVVGQVLPVDGGWSLG